MRVVHELLRGSDTPDDTQWPENFFQCPRLMVRRWHANSVISSHYALVGSTDTCAQEPAACAELIATSHASKLWRCYSGGRDHDASDQDALFTGFDGWLTTELWMLVLQLCAWGQKTGQTTKIHQRWAILGACSLYGRRCCWCVAGACRHEGMRTGRRRERGDEGRPSRRPDAHETHSNRERLSRLHCSMN